MEKQKRPTLDVTCRGDQRELGVALGERLREKILRGTEALVEFESFRLMQPWWLPLPLFQLYAQWRARYMLQRPITETYPAASERLRGMAEGASVTQEYLYLFHALESACSPLAVCRPAPALAGCSTIALRGSRTRDGRPMIAHNFDNVPQVSQLFAVRQRHGKGENRSIEFTIAPLCGVIDGVNEHGLCITYNFVLSTDTCMPGPPLSLAIDDALANCRSVREAVKRIVKRTRCGGGILMLADVEGDIASLELSSTRHRVRRPRGGADFLFHSNRFQTRRMQRVQVPPDAVFGPCTPRGLRGVRVHESPEARDLRMAQLLATPTRLDAADLAALMADHGPPGTSGGNSLCMHGTHWSTTACMQLFPATRRMRVAYDSACQASFEEFALN